jgi:small subunit ribosomal protein S7
MRRALKKKNIVKAESMYDSVRLSQFINCVMKDGKKNTARRVVYNALDQIKKEEKVENPIEIFEAAVRNVGPSMEVRSRRVGGANYQVPREVRPERRQALAMRWLLTAARAKKGSPMHVRLAGELVAASKNEGEAIRRKENTLKMAESNKAFAHFAW